MTQGIDLTGTMELTASFDLAGPLPDGLTVLEASAGTGKTYAIAALVTRYVAEGHAELPQLLVVTFTRMATAELRSRIRRRLLDAVRVLDTLERGDGAGAAEAIDGDDVLALLAQPEGRAERLANLRRAVADVDRAAISTIHGFCDRVLRLAGGYGGLHRDTRLLEDTVDVAHQAWSDAIVARFADETDPEILDLLPDDVTRDRLLAFATRDLTATVLPDPEGAPTPQDATGRRALLHAQLLQDVRGRIQRRLDDLGAVTFDGLLHRLDEALRPGPTRDGVLDAFRSRFTHALVDEFQDTDPVQWGIIKTLFEDRPLVLIGDPKQAIYRFRGADVAAYLEAVRGGRTERLDTNHRSDPGQVGAVNAIFRGLAFGSNEILHTDVRASRPRRLTDRRDRLDAEASLQLRLTDVDSEDVVIRDVARQVVDLLARDDDGAPLVTLDLADRDTSGIRPSDIAVLVSANRHVGPIQQALRDVGVPAVAEGGEGVYASEAARTWQSLLLALDEPGRTAHARTLAQTRLIGWDTRDVLTADEDAWNALQLDLHRWSAILRDHGVAVLLRAVLVETGAAGRQRHEPGGTRWLADLEHLADHLHEVNRRERLGALGLHAWLIQQGDGGTGDVVGDAAARLDTDADAVRILTVHKAKGLQFGVVLVPFPSRGAGVDKVARSYVPRDSRGRPLPDRVIDLRHDERDQSWRDGGDWAREETLGENARLLYVALTRAQHRTIAWWHNRRAFATDVWSKLLLSHGGAAPDITTYLRDRPSVTEIQTALASRPDGHGIVASVIDPDAPIPSLAPEVDDTSALDAAPLRQTFDQTWTRTSFSGLKARAHGDPVPGAVVESELDHVDLVRRDEMPADPLVETRPPVEVAFVTSTLPLGGFAGGAVVGTMWHDLLEHTPFHADETASVVAVDDDERGLVRDLGDDDPLARALLLTWRRRRDRFAITVEDPVGLARGLAAAVRTPLGEAVGGLRLADLRRADRIDELAYELPVAVTEDSTVFTVRAVADALDATLAADDPFRATVERLRGEHWNPEPVRGFLAGFIDLTLRRQDPDTGQPRFHVVDHKSNRLVAPGALEPTRADYVTERLVENMCAQDYALQALFYTVALHRFLRWRLGGAYDPDVHLGAPTYTYLRGMAGPPSADEPMTGVVSWPLPPEAVVAVSDVLAGGRS